MCTLQQTSITPYALHRTDQSELPPHSLSYRRVGTQEPASGQRRGADFFPDSSLAALFELEQVRDQLSGERDQERVPGGVVRVLVVFFIATRTFGILEGAGGGFGEPA